VTNCRPQSTKLTAQLKARQILQELAMDATRGPDCDASSSIFSSISNGAEIPVTPRSKARRRSTAVTFDLGCSSQHGVSNRAVDGLQMFPGRRPSPNDDPLPSLPSSVGGAPLLPSSRLFQGSSSAAEGRLSKGLQRRHSLGDGMKDSRELPTLGRRSSCHSGMLGLPCKQALEPHPPASSDPTQPSRFFCCCQRLAFWR